MWCFGYLFFKLRFLRLSVLFDKTDICIINVKINLTSRVYFLSTNFNSYPARFKE